MQTLIHADVFFFVTTIVIALLGLALLVLCIYLIFIIRDVRELSRVVKREGMEMADDVRMLRQEMRQEIRSGSSSAIAMFGFFKNLFMHRTHHRDGTRSSRENKTGTQE